MPNASGPAKTCIVCGTDCSNKPRTKDPKGRYYCKECYEHAKSQHQHSSSSPPAKRSPPKPQLKSGDDLLSLEPAGDDLGGLNILDVLVESPPSAPSASAGPCPSCGTGLAAGAMLCTNCGYNLQTHASVGAPTISKAKRVSAGGSVWPATVGIISMIFGGSGVLLYLFSLVAQILNLFQASSYSMGQVVGVILGGALSAWLLRSGWQIIQRNSDGVVAIRRWAIVKLLLYGTCLIVMMAIPFDDRAGTFSQRSALGGMEATALKAILLAVLGWFCLWPTLVLVFFSIARIREDVRQWD